jgi:hypothetical protein
MTAVKAERQSVWRNVGNPRTSTAAARKGFDAVELDDIDSFDPASTTGFNLTPGDAQNFLAYAFNDVHRHGMTVLWKTRQA